MKNLVASTALVLLAVVLLGSGADAYVLKAKNLRLVGSAEDDKTRFWQPGRAIKMGAGRVALRILTSDDGCYARRDCTWSAAWTADDGETFNVEKDVTDFCGTAGPLINNVLHCVDLSAPTADAPADVLSYGQVGFNVEVAGMLSSARFDRQILSTPATFSKPTTEDEMPTKIAAVGDMVPMFEDKNLYFRNVELVLANGTAVHALYQSHDGSKWTFVSFIPIDFGTESTLMRFGESKLYIISGVRGNYTQAESIYLGLRWEKITEAKFSTLMYTYISPYHTSILTGLKGQPGLFAAAQGSKKGSEKPVNLADLHNRMVKKSENDVSFAPVGSKNFTKEYMETELFECTEEPYKTDGESGCESTSVATIASPNNGTVIVFYDQLSKGYGLGGSSVYALRLHLNETKEEKEYEEKQKEAEKKAEEAARREEARKKAEKEAEKRRRQERREKRRKDKERREKFAAMDQPNLDRAAKEQEELDGEYVVIRNVESQWVDLEKDFY